MRILKRSFYNRYAENVAPDLLGKLLVHRVGDVTRIGRIVETEAYLGPHDLAAHSSKGRTARTEAMYGPPGHAYVYLIYGMYHCVNAVTGPGNHASAVLLRALEPVENLELSASGPGRLCRAMEIDRRHYGLDLTLAASELVIAQPPRALDVPFEVLVRPRVGVDYAKEWTEKPLRFSIAGNPYVSRA